jgi:hypothetical protein
MNALYLFCAAWCVRISFVSCSNLIAFHSVGYHILVIFIVIPAELLLRVLSMDTTTVLRTGLWCMSARGTFWQSCLT